MSEAAVARVVVVDGEVLVVDGVRALLASCDDIDVIGWGRTLAELERRLATTSVDIVVVGPDLPDGDVPAVIECVQRAGSSARVVVLADAPSAAKVAVAMDSGASAYLLRTQSSAEFIAALRIVHAGGHVLAPGAIEALVAPTRGAVVSDSLSPRQLEVLQAVARAGSARRAADDLAISPHTVRNHLQRVIERLGVHSTVEAVVIAVTHRLIEVSEQVGP